MDTSITWPPCEPTYSLSLSRKEALRVADALDLARRCLHSDTPERRDTITLLDQIEAMLAYTATYPLSA